MKRIISFFLFLLCFTILSGCAKQQHAPSGAGGSTKRSAVNSEEIQFSPIQNGAPIVTIETSKGTIGVVLFPKLAPLAAENFMLLAQQGYYNGSEFHRVVNEFIIQAGDTTGTELGGTSAWGQPFYTEYHETLRHYSGALCMANTGGKAHTNQSQFYILATLQSSITDETIAKMQNAGFRSEIIETYKQAGGAPYLDYTDTVFGQVYTGMDIVDSIARLATDEDARPRNPVSILSVTFSEYIAPAAENSSSAPTSSAIYSSSFPPPESVSVLPESEVPSTAS